MDDGFIGKSDSYLSDGSVSLSKEITCLIHNIEMDIPILDDIIKSNNNTRRTIFGLGLCIIVLYLDF